jgi:hypothetical protein
MVLIRVLFRYWAAFHISDVIRLRLCDPVDYAGKGHTQMPVVAQLRKNTEVILG